MALLAALSTGKPQPYGRFRNAIPHRGYAARYAIFNLPNRVFNVFLGIIRHDGFKNTKIIAVAVKLRKKSRIEVWCVGWEERENSAQLMGVGTYHSFYTYTFIKL